MKKNSKLLAIVGLVGLGVVIALAGLLVAVLPQRSKAQSLNGKIAAAQLQLGHMHNGHTRVPSVNAAALFQLAQAMPNTDDMPGILVSLSRAARASSVTVVSITPSGGVAQPDGSSAIPVRVVVDGRWSGVAAFLRGLRTQVQVHGSRLQITGRLFVVDSVQINPAPNGSEIEASLNANAYTYAPPPVPSSTGTGTTTTPSAGSTQAAASPSGSGG
jgi:Tfp pilus assembly protein PilO